ncbi:hypothetical protein CIHG_08900 [Coccidioides immitis H538.4]|uniref:Uncharacterized protein n=3 Tax=Coccidioides immitis TaxID=5501 RepID=A0A0J8TVI4_COCIT|nr:hypothetical protein CIRG_05259 [Coccidioides immitis RMSCC 2394]KMU77887.1 hypothetical protein CISG_06730 [Coccidioides immitis RMSCC 3703]KMU91151.1 hypothetical protein CIHG_08900 [Coccidioides immitis H538.4]
MVFIVRGGYAAGKKPNHQAISSLTHPAPYFVGLWMLASVSFLESATHAVQPHKRSLLIVICRSINATNAECSVEFSSLFRRIGLVGADTRHNIMRLTSTE